jgi:membrane peptidoglycan carboxypeptidase
VNPEEGAFLAFLLPNPKKYSQSFSHKKLTPFAEKTLKTILHKMLLGHKITDEEYAASIDRIPLFPWNGITPEENAQAPGAPNTSTDASSMDEEDNFNFDFAPGDEDQTPQLLPAPTPGGNSPQ